MIYSASLGSAVKKSQQDKAFLAQIGSIIAQMSIDPSVSGIDAVILGPKDVMGVNAAKVQAAINNKHKDVCVIYLYQKDTEKNLIKCEYTKQVRKFDDKAITDAVTEFLGSHLIKAGKMEVTSKDFTINGPATAITERPVEVEAPEPEQSNEPEQPVEEFVIPQAQTDALTGELTLPPKEAEEPAPTEPAPKLELDESKPLPVSPTTQEQINKIQGYHDFDLLKKSLEKDRVVASVLAENADYVQMSKMLEVLDANIKTVFIDSSLTPEERYEKIKSLGLQRSSFKGKANDLIIKKTIDIFEKVTSVVEEFVDDKVSTIEKSLTKVTLDKNAIENGTLDVEHLIQARTEMQVELMELMRNTIDTYKSMDTLVADELQQLDTDLPSSAEFINNVLAPQRSLFTPDNTGALASAIMASLQDKRITLSSIENRIRAVINVIFKICEQNDEIIKYQANLIKLLKTNRVEDIIVVDTMIKSVLRLYVGAEDTGSTATVLTQSGLQARTANTLIVDISGNGKWEDYGVTPYTWDQFITEHPHEPLCVVRADGSDPEKIHEIVVKLKESLEYYRYINMKVDYTQTDAINQLCDDALVAHIITDCRSSNVHKLKPAVDAIWTKDIAKKVILIDAPTDDIVSVITELGCDILTTKAISIPHLTAIKGCALSRKRPYLNDEIASTFEVAFR